MKVYVVTHDDGSVLAEPLGVFTRLRAAEECADSYQNQPWMWGRVYVSECIVRKSPEEAKVDDIEIVYAPKGFRF